MSRYLNIILVALIGIVLGTYSCEPRWDLVETAPCPSIDVITTEARAGDLITLQGKFVNYDVLRDRVTIGGIPTDPEAIFDNDEMMEVIVPENITDSIVTVVVNINGCSSDENPNIESSESSFNYKKVTVTDLSRDKAKHGEEIIISGTNFRAGDDFADNKVSFNSVLAEVCSASSTQLKVKVPKNELTPEFPTGERISGPISVEVDGLVASNIPEFTYVFTATVSLLAGTFGDSGPNMDEPVDSQFFNSPKGIDLLTNEGGSTSIFVADTGNHVIRRINPVNGQVFLHSGGFDSPDHINQDFDLLLARFNSPEDITIDASGNIFVTESENRTIRGIFNMPPVILTLAGNPNGGQDWVDSPPPDFFGIDARFYSPKGITVTNSGVLYASDDVDNRVRRMNQSTPYSVTTLAGGGILDPGPRDGIGLGAQFSTPSGLVYDATSDLIYVADTNNNSIRSITAAGDVNTVASNALGANFDHPSDVTIDADGNIYVLDTENNQIRRIDIATLEVTLFAGTGSSSPVAQPEEVPAELAEFNKPSGICYDIFTNIIYVADTQNHVIRKIELK